MPVKEKTKEKVSPDKKISQETTYETKDYDKFKYIKGNRQIDWANVKTISISIDQFGQEEAIIVNEKFEVIDGQHRLEACKKLLIPVKYKIRRGLKLKNIIPMNTQKSWTINDFINYYAKQNNQHYVSLINFMDVYRDIKCLHVYLDLLNGGYYRTAKLSGRSAIRDGSFKIKDWQWACEKADQIMEFKILKDYKINVWGHYCFFKALLKAFRHPDYNQKWFIKNIKKDPQALYRCANVHNYSRLFTEIYKNNILKGSNIKKIAFEYSDY